jgi:hypothetical protein
MSTTTRQSRMENPALVIEIASINAWNRINAAIHQVAMPFSG